MLGDCLDCMNCREPVAPADAKAFASVFLCPRCFTLAERVYTKGLAELQQLTVLLKESVRVALIQGRLTLGQGVDQELSKKEVLQTLLKMGSSADG